MTRYQSNAAANGTTTYLLTPNNSVAAPIPTNSVTINPPLAIITTLIAKSDQPSPKRSRIKSSRPRPVAAPSRAHISCTIPSERVTIIITQMRS